VVTAPEPVLTAELFAPDRAAFVGLLRELSAEDWGRPTVCAGWDVKDVVAHVIGGDLSNLSRRRDGYMAVGPGPGEELLLWLNHFNEEWVAASRRISPALLVDLLEHLGEPIAEYFGSLDPQAIGDPVSWAGPDRAPVWLDVAREYTERWVHQQHIREAVSKPGQREPRFLAPVLATFARALPHAYRDVAAAEAASIAVRVEGESGGEWSVVREGGAWRLCKGSSAAPTAAASLSDDTAWRLLTRGLTPEGARSKVHLAGDPSLAARVLDAVAIIA
jgi:uncharacterized protein (TIGR03083 family)